MDATYRARLAERQTTLVTRERQHAWISWSRLVLVVLAILLAVQWGDAAAWPIVGLVVVFVASLAVHARLLERRDRARWAVGFYERGLARLAYQWMGRGDAGERFRTADHPYADDLDVFGRGSLFELLATSRTQAGQATLAQWLSAPAAPDVIRERQAAVRELVTCLDLREAVAVLGDAQHDEVQRQTLTAWALAGSTRPSALVRATMAALSVVILGLPSGMYLLAPVPRWTGFVLLAALAAQAAFAVAWHGRAADVTRTVGEVARELALLSGVLRAIEDATFTSPRLVELQRAVGGSARPASSEIARLDRLVALLNSRSNLMVAIPAVLVAWATQMALAIETWRAGVGPHVPRWIDAIGEFEALLCLAGHAAEHPDYVVPGVAAGAPRLSAIALAHPLLPDTAVANDVALAADGVRLLVVSGSNMSGKSTFMRAIGLNVVLAQAGGVVRAEMFALTPITVGASTRVVDSLQDGRSRFLAEILRLKLIVALATSGRGAVLFLLDEILAGTNSHDRRIGAQAVVAGLVDAGSIGMVTTHDLALGEIASRMGLHASNVHFADRFDEGGLQFDYRLRPGVVRTSNALALMRSIGLTVPDEPS